MTTSLELLITTAGIALGSVLLAALIGVPFGSWIRTLDPRLERIISVVVLVPFLLPPLLVAMAFANLGVQLQVDSNFGILIILFAHAFMNMGFIARTVANSPLTIEQVDSARLDGASDFQIRMLVELPQLRPQLAAASLLVALYSATSFGLIRLLGNGAVDTLETQIAEAALVRLDLPLAWQLAALQTLLTLSLFLIFKRLGATPGILDQTTRSKLRVTRFEFLFAITAFALVAFVLLGVLARSFDGPGFLANFINLSTRGERNILNISVFDAAFNSLRNVAVVITLALPIAYLVARRSASSGWVLLPIGVSPVVVGLVTLALSGYLPRELTSSWILLPLVQTIFALPVAYQILRPALRSFDPEILDAARLDGANSLQLSFQIELPQITRSVALAVAFAAMVSLGEFGAASFLAFGSNETLPIVLFKLLGRPGVENLGMAMTTSTIHILLTACVIWLSLRPIRTLTLQR